MAAMAPSSQGFDLMSLAEGVDGVKKTRALQDLRSGSTIDKSLLSKFEQLSAEKPAPERRPSTGKIWTPPASVAAPAQATSAKPSTKTEVSPSPKSVATQPDFSATSGRSDDEPKSPRLSDNPFLKQDSLKRNSVTPPWEKTAVPVAKEEVSKAGAPAAAVTVPKVFQAVAYPPKAAEKSEASVVQVSDKSVTAGTVDISDAAAPDAQPAAPAEQTKEKRKSGSGRFSFFKRSNSSK